MTTTRTISFMNRIIQDEELSTTYCDYETEQRRRRVTAILAIFGQVERLSVPCLYVPFDDDLRQKYGEKIPGTLVLDDGKPAVVIDDEIFPDAPFYPVELDICDDEISVNGTTILAETLFDIFTI